ncbi:hypothetical protein F5Y16DRAFT_135965 [Xylariaceae sp. FL0255]|nr:hypothetical protein F5Y16DRAFT_135965 [Xylariaceae sp. FL0255]
MSYLPQPLEAVASSDEEEDQDSNEEEERYSEEESDSEQAMHSLAILREKLDRIEQHLSTTSFVLKLDSDKGEQQQFLKDYDEYLAREPPKGIDNVLHLMAGKRYVSQFLIQHMLSKHGERMDDLDNANRRPLTLAIETKKKEFVRAVLESSYPDADLERILAINSTDTGNCIHKAIINGLSAKLTIDLINKVSEEVLMQKDSNGCTPLHLSVEYGRCTAAQLGVVKALLNRGGSAADVRNNTNLSAYRYHFSTELKEERKSTRTKDNPKAIDSKMETLSQLSDLPQMSGIHSGEDLGMDSASKRLMGIEYEGERSISELLNLTPRRGTRLMTLEQDNRMLDAIPESLTASEGHRANISRRATGSRIAVPEKAMNVSATHKSSSPKIMKKSTRRVTKESAERIADELKLQYLRSTFTHEHRNHESALDFLYPSNQVKQICFDLLQRKKPIQERSFRTGCYSRFEFDNSLQYVLIGPISIQNRQLMDLNSMSPDGRRDIVTLFEWLQSKGVKNIIKVVVQEQDEPFHSDEAIIASLSHFNIEILDWRKPDLCPEAINTACHNVRELHLYWSGINGMLLAWGGSEGLANLPSLTDIYLHQTKNLESREWTNARLDNFEKRLNRNRNALSSQQEGIPVGEQSSIRVHRPKGPPTVRSYQTAERPNQERNKEEVPVRDHQWLGCMDQFATEIFAIKPEECMESVENLPAVLKQNVRICLIDDGVDIEHLSIAHIIQSDGKAFGSYNNDEYRGMMQPFYRSDTNHGTLMASMIARVSPFASITSYRLDTRPGEDQKVHFTVKSAADALEQAVKQNFDIISMSWSVKHIQGTEENNTKDIDRIKTALRQAENSKLLFCSSPDMGNITLDEFGNYLPVGFEKNSVFRIGAATADSNASSRTGGYDLIEFNFPGQDVREKLGTEVSMEDTSLKSGSSIATALASGFAALMIHVVRMAVIHTYKHGKENSSEANILKLSSLEAIKSPTAMRKTFASMAKNNYVHVYAEFDQRGKDLLAAREADNPTEWFKIIGELARDIVSSKMSAAK